MIKAKKKQIYFKNLNLQTSENKKKLIRKTTKGILICALETKTHLHFAFMLNLFRNFNNDDTIVIFNGSLRHSCDKCVWVRMKIDKLIGT